jgi:diguanylate cyclase (GGDEF)-like protein
MLPSDDHRSMFDLAPVSLWLEDWSGLKALFDRWRAEGVEDIRAHLQAEPDRVVQCMAQLKVVQVNRQTLRLLGAASQEELVARLGEVFRGEMAEPVLYELTQLWQGNLDFDNQSVNYSLDGRRLDVHVRIRVLPGHEARWDRVLVSLDDISERVRAEAARDANASYARGLFERSPVSLWVEDFSAIKQLLTGVRAQGIQDFGTFLKVHPEFVNRCMQEIRVLDVNEETLRMFGATDKQHLLRNLPHIFRDEMEDSFAEQLRDLWDGKTLQQREVLNYSLTGEPINIYMQFAVLQDHLEAWDLVLVSLVDITARKRAEAYLEYLGTHDVLTQLRNRTYYSEEIKRLARKGPWPVSVLAIDMNGLKRVNDEVGHAAGDALLRRAGEVLSKVVDAPACAARVGGDEFAVLLPGTEERGAAAVRERLQSLIDMNNQFYVGTSGHHLSFAIGAATCLAGESLEAALQRADRLMYVDKARHYDLPANARGAP